MQLNNCGKIATRKWEQLDERFPEIEIDEFIIMPDHMHGIIVIPDVNCHNTRIIHQSPDDG